MKWSRFHGISPAIVLLWVMVLAGQAHAACDTKDRIKHEDAECLTAEWDNDIGVWSIVDVAAKNECSDLGTVVAKVDRKACPDYTWHLTGSDTMERNGTWCDVRHVYCCSDLSDLCNRSDLSNDD